ncbi:uncharacterized protein LOC130898686 isoform X1 [Diorhabda carinulata]|uniref:uncharacterized protein LOC130898686 isoform X1 n=1 Tax=Diorhabda carinulata TaxID=1163345 RepID=UPI0025A0D421|nr:uncharacterized protein LOC130898686 isoform X1 [Diorhabda carinulata]
MAKLFRNNHKLLQCLQKKQIILYGRNNSTASDEFVELDEKTLTGRFLMYMSNFVSKNTKEKYCVPKINYNTIKNIRYDAEQIKSSIKLLDISQDTLLFKEIDKECHDRVKYLKTSDILEILHIYMKKVPNKIVSYEFYESAIKELSKRLQSLDKNGIIQLIFYIGLRKKMSREHELLRKCVNQLLQYNSLSNEDLCIICNTVFKTTTRIKTDHLYSKIISNIYDNLQLFKDPAFFVTFLKTIRQNRYQDDEFLNTMTCTIFFNKTLDYYSFSALGHILAVYSDYLYYDENILRVFTERCVELLKETKFVSSKDHMSSNIRLKDIKRFLWCISNLNYKLSVDDIKSVIVPKIYERIRGGDVEVDYCSLVEICLYLWMLKYRAYELLPYFLTKENIERINNLTTPLKQRLNVLLSCIYYEDRELLKDLDVQPSHLPYNMENQLEKRPFLTTVVTSLNKNEDIPLRTRVSKLETSCQIPGIHIIGITGYNDKTGIHIEVLDEYTTLKNTEYVPTGLMQLKLRLLEHLEEGLITIEAEDLKSLNEFEIKKILFEEIEFVS